MIIFFSLLLIILIIGCVTVGYFAAVVPFLAKLVTPLVIICVGVGITWAVIFAIEIYNKIRGKK